MLHGFEKFHMMVLFYLWNVKYKQTKNIFFVLFIVIAICEVHIFRNTKLVIYPNLPKSLVLHQKLHARSFFYALLEFNIEMRHHHRTPSPTAFAKDAEHAKRAGCSLCRKRD